MILRCGPKWLLVGCALAGLAAALNGFGGDLQTPAVFRGTLSSSAAGAKNYPFVLEIRRFSSAAELRDLQKILQDGDDVGFERALNATGLAVLKYSRLEGRTIVFAAASETAAEKGTRIVLLARDQSSEPGLVPPRRDRPVKPEPFRCLIMSLDLSPEFSGQGQFSEHAQANVTPERIELASSPAIPRPVIDVRLEGEVRPVTESPREDGTPPPSRGLRTAAKALTGLPAKWAEEGVLDIDMTAYEKGEYLLQRALTAAPGAGDLRWRRGFALLRLERLEEAAAEEAGEIEINPGNWTARTLLGFIHYRMKKIEEAEADCRAAESMIERLFPEARVMARAKNEIPRLLKSGGLFYFPAGSPRAEKEREDDWEMRRRNAGLASFLIGLICEEKGRWSEAALEYRKAAILGYDPAACLMRQVLLELTKGSPNAAIGKAWEIMDVAGIHPALLAGLAHVLQVSGRAREALDALEIALELRPFDARLLRAIGLGRVQFGETGEARILLQRAAILEKAGRTGDAAPKGMEKVSTEDFASAVGEACRGFLEEHGPRFYYPSKTAHENILRMIGNEFFMDLRSGKTTEASDLLSRYIASDDSSPELHYNLALLLKERDRIAESFRAAWTAVELKPNYRDAMDVLAGLYLRIGDYAYSMREYQAALDVEPRDPLASYNLGCAEAIAEKTASAEKHLKDAIRWEGLKTRDWPIEPPVDPKSLDHTVLVKSDTVSYLAYMGLGGIYGKTERLQEGLAAFTMAAQLKPKSPDAYGEIARLLIRSGERQKAQAYIQKFSSLGGSEEKAKELLR